uniref:Ribose-phosphate pyrophosphokinase 1 n=1 Tax=Blastobotrys adeninivorans TaxID=409370 RepID=A0A060SZ17_BLAAD
MRKSHVFVGSSHPELGELICSRLGVEPGKCSLKKFSNGETSVEIGVSVRDEDIYIVQSGSGSINDHIMELLVLIAACRGGSANKITAVVPLFPYSKQSKMKKHRGAITARMLANLLIMAGADHVITMDLHATQMQGFFTKPVDNLYAGPTLARWIRHNVPDYHNSVIVSKNPGGTKRVTALADALKVNFAMIHTDRRRTRHRIVSNSSSAPLAPNGAPNTSAPATVRGSPLSIVDQCIPGTPRRTASPAVHEDKKFDTTEIFSPSGGSPNRPSTPERGSRLDRGDDDESDDEVVSVHGVQMARVVQGHVVDDDYVDESETLAAAENGNVDVDGSVSSEHTANEGHGHALGGTVDVSLSDDEDDEQFQQEKVITLVGDVRDKYAIIIDDMIDRPGSFIAAAEHCRLNCGAKKVYIVATHGIFGGDSLERLNDSDCIDQIVVTNTYPIPAERVDRNSKLTVIDISPIFAECIRRNHHGESISALFERLAYV